MLIFLNDYKISSLVNFWVCKEDCLSTISKQFCDVTNVVIINKQVLPNLVINDVSKEKVFSYFNIFLLLSGD
jgi:hypothetical protein